MWAVTLIIDPGGTAKPIHNINHIMMGVSSTLWLMGTISVVAWDIIRFGNEELSLKKRPSDKEVQERIDGQIDKLLELSGEE